VTFLLAQIVIPKWRADPLMAVVCPLLRGQPRPDPIRTSWLRGLRACFLSGISGWSLLSLGPRAEQSGAAKMVSAGGDAGSTRSGRLAVQTASGRTMERSPAAPSADLVLLISRSPR